MSWFPAAEIRAARKTISYRYSDCLFRDLRSYGMWGIGETATPGDIAYVDLRRVYQPWEVDGKRRNIRNTFDVAYDVVSRDLDDRLQMTASQYTWSGTVGGGAMAVIRAKLSLKRNASLGAVIERRGGKRSQLSAPELGLLEQLKAKVRAGAWNPNMVIVSMVERARAGRVCVSTGRADEIEIEASGSDPTSGIQAALAGGRIITANTRIEEVLAPDSATLYEFLALSNKVRRISRREPILNVVTADGRRHQVINYEIRPDMTAEVLARMDVTEVFATIDADTLRDAEANAQRLLLTQAGITGVILAGVGLTAWRRTRGTERPRRVVGDRENRASGQVVNDEQPRASRASRPMPADAAALPRLHLVSPRMAGQREWAATSTWSEVGRGVEVSQRQVSPDAVVVRAILKESVAQPGAVLPLLVATESAVFDYLMIFGPSPEGEPMSELKVQGVRRWLDVAILPVRGVPTLTEKDADVVARSVGATDLRGRNAWRAVARTRDPDDPVVQAIVAELR